MLLRGSSSPYRRVGGESPGKLGLRTVEGTNTPSAGAMTSGEPKHLSFPVGGLRSLSTQENTGLCQSTWHVEVTSFHPGSQELRAGSTAVVIVFRPWLVVPGARVACSPRALAMAQSSARQQQSLKGPIQQAPTVGNVESNVSMWQPALGHATTCEDRHTFTWVQPPPGSPQTRAVTLYGMEFSRHRVKPAYMSDWAVLQGLVTLWFSM